MLVIENTHNRGGGSVWPIEQIKSVTDRARAFNLRTHLDGARIWNACAKTGIKPAEYAQHFDTISCCFSKGLGAPVGSAVCGPVDVIQRVHRFRKMFGGTMRQSGILAAAALYALDHHVARLSEDHAHAQKLATGLSAIKGLTIALPVETNMVFVDVAPTLATAAEVCNKLRDHQVLALPNAPWRIRMVCHLDITSPMIEKTIKAFASL
jgi:threonine aldolase